MHLSSRRIMQYGSAPLLIMHRDSASQPIMYGSAPFILASLPDDRPLRPLVDMWLLIRSAITIETIALRTVIYHRQSQSFLPTVHKQRTPPMPLIALCSFFSVLLSFMVMLEFFKQHLGCDLLLWCRRALSFTLRLLPFDFIGRNLSFRVNSSRFPG